MTAMVNTRILPRGSEDARARVHQNRNCHLHTRSQNRNMTLSLPLIPKYNQLNATTSDDESVLGKYALFATLAFTLVVFLWEAYLNLRQRASYFKTTFPKELEVTVAAIDAEAKEEKKTDNDGGASTSASADDKDKVDKAKPLLPQLKAKFSNSQSYGRDKISYSIAAAIYNLSEEFVYLMWGFYPYVWDGACSLGSQYFGWTEQDNEIQISLIFLSIFVLVGTVTSLPFELYSTFCIEKKHGFNKQTPALFFTDKVKGLFLSAVIGMPFLALLLKIIKSCGDHFYIYVWAFTFVFSVFMMTIVPVLIMPWFNKYEPLPEGKLKEEIFELAGQLKFPLTKLFVVDGSKRSSHSNAYMFGFFKNKR